MSEYRIETAGAVRRCRSCSEKIQKGQQFLLKEEGTSGTFRSYDNLCCICAPEELEPVIKHLQEVLKYFNKINKWDQ